MKLYWPSLITILLECKNRICLSRWALTRTQRACWRKNTHKPVRSSCALKQPSHSARNRSIRWRQRWRRGQGALLPLTRHSYHYQSSLRVPASKIWASHAWLKNLIAKVRNRSATLSTKWKWPTSILSKSKMCHYGSQLKLCQWTIDRS